MDNLMCFSLRKLRVCLKIWNPTLTGFIKKCIGPSKKIHVETYDSHTFCIYHWLVVSTPLKNISQWEGLSHILWKIIQMFETTNQFIITYPYQFSDCYTFKRRNRLGGDTDHKHPRDTTGNDDDEIQNTNLS